MILPEWWEIWLGNIQDHEVIQLKVDPEFAEGLKKSDVDVNIDDSGDVFGGLGVDSVEVSVIVDLLREDFFQDLLSIGLKMIQIWGENRQKIQGSCCNSWRSGPPYGLHLRCK